MAHCQRHCGIGALLRSQPQIAEFSDFSVIRGDGDRFSPFVANFREEVRIWGTGLRNVGTPGDDVAGVIPVGRFRNVSLLTPGLRRRRRQVTVPIVEAQAGAANQRQISCTGGVGNHRHRRDRREARHAVRTVGFNGVNVRSGNQLIHFLPGRTHETTTTTRLFEAFCFIGVFDDGGPCVYRIAVQSFRFTPHFHQAFAHQRVFQTVSAVEIPGIACTTRATTRLVVWQVRTGTRIIGLLGFPGHQTIFHIDFPAA